MRRPSPHRAPRHGPRLNAADDEYKRVTASGHFLNDRETLVQAVTERGTGFWVLTPLRDQRRLHGLVNRGFVPAERRDPASRAEGQPSGETAVTGLLRMSGARGAASCAPTIPLTDRWYSARRRRHYGRARAD